eukprot:scaffold232956_cov35-Tisochrysis_lutea.AAC.3
MSGSIVCTLPAQRGVAHGSRRCPCYQLFSEQEGHGKLIPRRCHGPKAAEPQADKRCGRRPVTLWLYHLFECGNQAAHQDRASEFCSSRIDPLAERRQLRCSDGRVGSRSHDHRAMCGRTLSAAPPTHNREPALTHHRFM